MPPSCVPDGGLYTPRVMVMSPRDPPPPAARIGILGGGQLGRMLAIAARALGYRIAVLDPDPDCPAAAGIPDVETALACGRTALRRLCWA